MQKGKGIDLVKLNKKKTKIEIKDVQYENYKMELQNKTIDLHIYDI